ncbi:hypothetical protein H6F89_30785 [Cyanobacteria bacterium FACHB-63]|nr:hypothetical protein [Cyanobacteria bacterium FACHB-63]
MSKPMNPKHNPPDFLSQSDTDLWSHLTDLAETLEPNPTFQANLEAELLQAHLSNSSQTPYQEVNPVIARLSWFNSRNSLAAFVSIAIAAALIIPFLTSGRATGWFTAILNSTVDSKANAQTIAQALETGQITLTADAQEYDEITQNIRAIGNAAFVYPEAQIRAKADEIRYTATARQVTLLGNVQISQRGETLQGIQAVCSLEQKQCKLTQE